MLIRALYQVQSIQMKFSYTWDIGVQIKHKILIDHQAVLIKTTKSPSCSGVPEKCKERREARMSLQTLHPYHVKSWLT